MSIELIGTYGQTKNKNFDNGFTLFTFYCKNHEEYKENGHILCKGYLPVITKGVPLLLTGEFKTNFVGTNVFVVEDAKLYSNSKLNTLEYLSSDRFRGIGPKTAEKIIEICGPDIFSFVHTEHAKEKLSQIAELKKSNKLENLIQTIEETFFEKDVYEFIREYGGSYANSQALYNMYKTNAIDKMKQNPYDIGRELEIPFIVCDSIAKGNNFYFFHHSRIRYLVMSALYNITSSGHTIAKLEDIYKNVTYVAKQSAFPEFVPTCSVIACTIQNLNNVTTLINEKGERIYMLKEFAMAEQIIVNNLYKIHNKKEFYNVDIEEIISKTEEKFNIKYSENQKNSFYFLRSSGVKILTGGPGTGKTTVINGIIDAYKTIHGNDKIVVLCAPTGRASQKIKEATGHQAFTMHRLLNIKPYDAQKDNYYETDELIADLIIVDEFSMVDTKLFAYMMNAVKDEATIILCGDTFQLPSVGAGNVLHDMIDSECFEVEHLNVIYRQKENSPIISFAQEIKNGIPDNFIQNAKTQNVIVGEEEIPIKYTYKSKSLQLLETNSPENIHKIIVNTLDNTFLNKASRFYVDDILNLQVLSPIKKEKAGVNLLNKDIHLIYQKESENFNQNFFNIGDKVMMTENNYDVGYCNGDIGFIKEIDLFKNSITIEINSENIEIPHSLIKDVTLCYACTIHKSQGSEYDRVIIALPAEPKSILQRNLIYTALTRAKKYAAIIYENNALAETIKRNYITKRKTNLKNQLTQTFSNRNIN